MTPVACTFCGRFDHPEGACLTGPRVVPDIAGRDVSGGPGYGGRDVPARAESVSGSHGRRGTAHALHSEPGYHRGPVHVSVPLRALWARLTGH